MKSVTMVIVICAILIGVTGAFRVSVAQDNTNTEEAETQATDNGAERERISTPDEGDTSGKSNYGIFEDESPEGSN